MRATLGADDIYCVGRRLRRIGGEELSDCIEIVVSNLDAHATDGVGVKPVHLDEVLVLDVCVNTGCLQPSAEEMCFFGFAKCGDRFHEQLAKSNDPKLRDHGATRRGAR